jgi:hypothetical protein
MKIVSIPDEIAYAQPDWSTYDPSAEREREAAHQETLKTWLQQNGWAGPRTGQELMEPHADGYARYMYGDGARAVLVHLPYGDGWDSPNVEHLPKKEVLKRIDRQISIAELFSKAA